MLEAAFWGLIQGLTEFLPVSSSGHLVLIPALLGQEPPDLATTAVLHLGTLAAVIVYYWTDVLRMARFRSDPEGRRILWLILVGTIPAAIIGLALADRIDELFEDPVRVAFALMITGVILLGSRFIKLRNRSLKSGNNVDAITVGTAQAAALIPGISRSGMTITGSMGRGFDRTGSARFAFLLGIPAIAGAGLLQAIDLAGSGEMRPDVWVGAAVAAVTGYLAIALLLRLLGRVGLVPFGIYCIAFGAFAAIRL